MHTGDPEGIAAAHFYRPSCSPTNIMKVLSDRLKFKFRNSFELSGYDVKFLELLHVVSWCRTMTLCSTWRFMRISRR